MQIFALLQAALISVRIATGMIVDWFEDLQRVIDNIKANPGGELQSLVESSRSMGEEYSHSKLQSLPLGPNTAGTSFPLARLCLCYVTTQARTFSIQRRASRHQIKTARRHTLAV
jgi:hypothetical protein